MNQKYTSEKTSINRVNKIYTNLAYVVGSTVLDYGGGKYDTNKEFMKGNKVEVLVYDKYNRTEEHNEAVVRKCLKKTPDYIVCSNVLNVIMEDEIIDEVLNIIYALANYESEINFVIYEGNKSGIGQVTKMGYQRNQLTSEYIEKIEKYFDIYRKSGNIIQAIKREELND